MNNQENQGNSLVNDIPTEKVTYEETKKPTLKRKRKVDNEKLSEKPSEKPSSNIKMPNLNSITSKINGFILNVQGTIENASFFEGEAIYCKYDIEFGPDWKLLNGQKTGQSQYACQGEGINNFFVWNLPFELTLNSNNPTGWPQIVISCSGPDFFGREVTKAYGLCYIPTTPGVHTRTLQLFSPISSSSFIDFIGRVFFGQRAEIINAPKVMATGEGREVMRTQSEGTMTIKFNIQLTNMEELGYNF